MSIKSIKSVMPHVKALLTKHHELRDSDDKLIALVWHNEALNILGVDALNKVTGWDLLKLVYEGKLTSPESIRRARQKIQQIDPNFRGSNYVARHIKKMKIKTELRYNP
jgi:spermidine/putrescine-binding protein